MRVLISGGGTGGHVYPALAVVEQLDRAVQQNSANEAIQEGQGAVQRGERVGEQAVNALGAARPNAKLEVIAETAATGAIHAAVTGGNQAEILWVGSKSGMEQKLIERAGIDYTNIDTGQLNGVNPLKALQNLVKMVKGVRQALAILDTFRPEVCLVTGGYVCAPVVFACRYKRIPVLIYLPDMTPGWAIRGLSLLAQRVAVSFPDAASFFGGEVPRGKAIVTGYPVRAKLLAHIGDRASARHKLATALKRPLANVDMKKSGSTSNASMLPLLLVWGGSQGSRSINQALWKIVSKIVPYAHILHVIGIRDWNMYLEKYEAKVRTQVLNLPTDSEPCTLFQRYHPVPYLHEEMALALAAADLTVARAGASTLGEFPVARLPSILVPLPFAGVNQWANAQQLTAQEGAILVEDQALDQELEPTLLDLLQDQKKRHRMEQALVQLANPDAAYKIATALHELGNDIRDA